MEPWRTVRSIVRVMVGVMVLSEDMVSSGTLWGLTIAREISIMVLCCVEW